LLEKIAWELYTETGAPRHTSNTSLYTQFNQLIAMFTEKVKQTHFHYPPYVSHPVRQVTATLSLTDVDLYENATDFNYKNFATYHNTYHRKFLEAKINGTVLPEHSTESEIVTTITRTMRYLTIVDLINDSVTKLIESTNTSETFDSMVDSFNTFANRLINDVCVIYTL
jgi:hypothetical protein